MTAVELVLLYGAEVWAGALEKKMHRKRLFQVHRRKVLRVVSANRTVAEAAVLVIDGVIPICLLTEEREAIYLMKGKINKETASRDAISRAPERWWRAWGEEMAGRWTAQLIKWSLRPCIQKNYGELVFFVMQLLSGHRYIQPYLHKMGRATFPNCLYYVIDEAEHSFTWKK